MSYWNTKDDVHDPYREWSYLDRCDAGRDDSQRENCRRYDEDRDSSERAYEEMCYLKMNGTGEPSHPLYLKSCLLPKEWEDAENK